MKMDIIVFILVCLAHQGFGALPDSVTPTLTLLPQYENETDFFIGERSKLQLTAAFPSGTTSDVNIELLPSTNVTVMGLGDVTVSKVGSNLDISSPTVVKYETEDTKSTPVKIYNRGVFTIGDITNSGLNTADYAESTLVIEFEAVVASISAISDSDTHWVSAGIEYNNSYNVWVGQVSHIIRTVVPNATANATYELSDVGGYTLGINSIRQLIFKAWIPYPYPSVAAEVIVLTNTTDSLHVIGLRLVDAGNNYKYMIDFTKTMSYQTSCTRLNRKRVDLGSIYNKGALEGGNMDDNLLVFEAYLFLEPQAQVGDLFSFGVGVEVAGTEVWVTHLNMTAAEVSSPTTGSLSLSLSPQGLTTVKIGEAIVLEANLTTPENTSMSYTIDVETSHVGAGDPGLRVAIIDFLSAGEHIPCLPTPNVTYSLDSKGFMNKGTLTANITNYGLPGVTSTNASDIVLRIGLIVMPSKAVDGQTYRTTVTVTPQDGTQVSKTQDYTVSGTVTYDTSVNYTFHLYHKCQKNCITVGSIFEFFIDVSTERDTNPGPAVFEFPVPASINDTSFSVCKFEIIDIGKNVICVNSDAAIAASNLTTLSDGTHERVRMGITPLCNVGLVDDEKEDNFTIRVIVKINLNDTSPTEGLFEWYGVGAKYSATQIWVAQYKLWIKSPMRYPDLAILEGVAIDSADAANITWPGNNEIQMSSDGNVYSAAQVTWPTPTSNGTHDIYMLPHHYLVSYLRMVMNQCESGCYVEHEFLSKSLEDYLEIFNDQSGSYKQQFVVVLDKNQDSCFNLPVQGAIPPVYWVRFNTTLLQVNPQSFNFSVTGEGISCNPTSGTKVLQVSYPTSSSVGKFHGDLKFCKNTQSGSSGGKTTCVYDCNCPDESQCSEIYLFMANSVEGDTDPWTLCEMSASNL